MFFVVHVDVAVMKWLEVYRLSSKKSETKSKQLGKYKQSGLPVGPPLWVLFHEDKIWSHCFSGPGFSDVSWKRVTVHLSFIITIESKTVGPLRSRGLNCWPSNHKPGVTLKHRCLWSIQKKRLPSKRSYCVSIQHAGLLLNPNHILLLKQLKRFCCINVHLTLTKTRKYISVIQSRWSCHPPSYPSCLWTPYYVWHSGDNFIFVIVRSQDWNHN